MMLAAILFFSTLFAGVLLFSAYFMIAVFIGAPFLPTGMRYVEKMLDDVGLKPGETFVDLGAGDGRMVIAAARRGVHAIGYEINPFLVALSLARIRIAGLHGRAHVHWQSFWNADLRRVDVVSIFGITNIMPRLEKKLERELHPGARLVSYVFSLPNWEPTLHHDGIRVYMKK